MTVYIDNMRLRASGNRTTLFLAVDHDHDTGKMRGLLCHNCNAAIGNLGDNPRLVQKALDYLLGR